MKRGTTYPIVITITGIDLTDAVWIIVSLKARAQPMIEFARDQLLVAATSQGTTLTLTLTQEQSVALSVGSVTIDVNWMMDGVRGGCFPQTISITDTLLARVVENA